MREQGVGGMVIRLRRVVCCCPTMKWLICFLVDMWMGMQWILPPLIPWLLLAVTVGFVRCIIPRIDRSSNGNFTPSWIAFSVSREEQKVPTCSRRNVWLCENLDFLNRMHFTTWLISIVPRALLFWRHNDPNNDTSYCGCRISNLSHITLPYASSKKVHFHIAIAMHKMDLVFFKMVETKLFMKWTQISSSPTCTEYQMVQPDCRTKPNLCQAKT